MRWFDKLLTGARVREMDRLVNLLAEQAIPLVLQRIQAVPRPQSDAQARGFLLAFAGPAVRRANWPEVTLPQSARTEIRTRVQAKVVSLALPLWTSTPAAPAIRRLAG